MITEEEQDDSWFEDVARKVDPVDRRALFDNNFFLGQAIAQERFANALARHQDWIEREGDRKPITVDM